jgi:hypothetical protein
MRKNIRNIDALVKKVIEESLQEKADELTNKVKTKMDEWTPQEPLTLSGVGVTEENDADSDIESRLCDEDSDEYDEERCSYNRKAKMVGSEMDEELIGGQKKLDKNKNGRLDKQDFKMLRGDVEEQRDEDDLDWGDKETAMSRMRRGKGDVEDIDWEDVEPESTDFGMEPLDNTRLGDEEYMSDWENRFRDWMKNSKTDEKGYPKYHQKKGKFHHGEEMDEQVFPGDFDDLDDEKEIDDYVIGPFGTPEKKDFRRGVDLGKPSFLGKLKNKLKFGKHEEEMDEEEEVEEGNAFTGALAKTKKGDKFNLDGKSYTDRSNLEEAEKFIQKAVKKMDKKGTEGSFKEYCGGEVTKSCIDKAMKSGDPKLVKKANFAKNIKAYHGAEHKKKNVKESLQLTESEMIDLIEKIVMEQKKAKGMAETEKVLSANKKENEDAIKAVTKKMKEYLTKGHEGEYETNPEQFPQSNGQMKRQNAMKYVPSDAVEEYIDAFAHPGQTNIRFDEIKPDDKKIDKYLKGDSTTGNAVKDKKGKALGNVVPSKVGEKFKKNYEDNLYGAEQSEASYKRQSQPVDVTGDSLQKGHLKTKKSSTAKAQKVLDNVDESTSKKDILISEEFDKMKHLMGYNKNTQ